MRRSDAVDPVELALILLKNAHRLIDESGAPAEIRTQIERAMEELEEMLRLRRG